MRTFEEILADINAATLADDVKALQTLAQEMQALGTPRTEASAQLALGLASTFSGKYESALGHYRQALALNEEMGNREGAAVVISEMGIVYKCMCDYPSSLEYLQRSLALAEELGDHRGVANVLTNMAIVHVNIGNETAALEYYGRAQSIYTEIGDHRGVALVTGNMAVVYERTGNAVSALESYRRALAYHEETENSYLIANVTAGIGTLYKELGDYPESMENYRRALKLFEEVGNPRGIALTTTHLGILFSKTGNTSTALEHFQRALNIFEEIGNRIGAAQVITSIGNEHHQAGDYDAALEHYRRALAVCEETGDQYGSVLVTSNVIEVLLDQARFADAAEVLKRQASMPMNDPRVQASHVANIARCAEHDGDLEAARDHLKKALNIVTEVGLRPEAATYHQHLRDLAQKRNDFAGYIEHNNEYNRITEEIRGKEATQRLTMMEAERKMEAERRERDKERALLYGALPESVATRMLRGEDVSGDHYDNAAVLFLDIVGFTAISDQLHPGQVVQFLEQVFSSLDVICKKHELTKIKTIGDSYMAVAFPRSSPSARNDNAHLHSTAIAALEMLDSVLEIMIPNGSPEGSPERSHVSVRIGVDCGAVTAGVLGKERLQYDVWGDTVNVASRMESTGEPGRIHVSEQFALFLGLRPRNDSSSPIESEEPGTWHLVHRGETEVKGKGLMTTYWLEAR